MGSEEDGPTTVEQSLKVELSELSEAIEQQLSLLVRPKSYEYKKEGSSYFSKENGSRSDPAGEEGETELDFGLEPGFGLELLFNVSLEVVEEDKEYPGANGEKVKIGEDMLARLMSIGLRNLGKD